MTSDLTIVYYTANKISNFLFKNTRKQLLKVAASLPIISVSQKPIDLGENICIGDIGYNSLNIYKQALIGAKKAKSEYIALAEDDVLYSPDHFSSFPRLDKFIYNNNLAKLFTWHSNEFVYGDSPHGALLSLICRKDLFITAMEERFAKYPNEIDKPKNWTEPGRAPYEKLLGVKPYENFEFTSKIANVVFCGEEMLGFKFLGRRKKLGGGRFTKLAYWGNSDSIMKLYEK